MTFGAELRRVTLTGHIVVSVGWIGAAAAYLALGIAAAVSQDVATVRAGWIAMWLTGWFVIVPLACLSLVTGVLLALGTPWGLFRHYWVVIALARPPKEQKVDYQRDGQATSRPRQRACQTA